REIVEKAADQVVAQLAFGMSWLEEEGPVSVHDRASMLRRSLGEDLFNGCVSFDEGTPQHSVLKALLVEGAHRSDWQAPFPKWRKREALTSRQKKTIKSKKAIKQKVTRRKMKVRKVKKR
ncbi:MAG: hypothetical protein INH37_11425, partial [Myxococcaceae bacterium]|nr:hypothetical protein [Myxococcaceae bacterium]